MAKINDFQIKKNFNLKEFECSHCGAVKLHPDLIDRLQKMREELGASITVTSGYRCPTHNTKVGGSPTSQHLKGTAADIRASNMIKLKTLVFKYFSDGGIGINYPNHIHVDVRGKKARW